MFKIFTENGDKIGNGHVSRCLLLYNQILKLGNEAIIYLNKEGNDTFLKNCNYQLVDWWNGEVANRLIDNNDFVIVDSYIASKEVLEIISNNAKNVLFVDDYDRMEYPKGLVFCPTLLNDNSRVLSGEEFFLVRQSFYSFKKNMHTGIVNQVFLSLGTDINNCLDEIINVILSENKNIQINVITNREINVERVKTFYNLDEFEMAELISKCDLSIVSSGQTLLENLVIRQPFIALLTADNQMRNYEFIQNKKLINYFLDVRDIDFIQKFKTTFKEQIKPNKLKTFYQKSNLKNSRDAAAKIIKILTKEY